jgi:DNA/RNA-binding domain of Phe-tRNA-synthetase-like protein
MLKRVSNGNYINFINPLVDIYNSVSLKYAFPCGGEDFVTLGSDKNPPPYKGEIIYKDEKGAICRCWNWRESVRTMLTENTTNAFLCIELIDENRFEKFKESLKYLGDTIQENLGGNLTIEILDASQCEIKID